MRKGPGNTAADDAMDALTRILDARSRTSYCLAAFLHDLWPKLDEHHLRRARRDVRSRNRLARQVVNAWMRFQVQWMTGRGYELRKLAGLMTLVK